MEFKKMVLLIILIVAFILIYVMRMGRECPTYTFTDPTMTDQIMSTPL